MKYIRTLALLQWSLALVAGLWLLLASTMPAAAAPAMQTAPLAVSKYESVNVRSGPSTNYPLVGTLIYGETCPILGRDTTTGWWLISCASGVTGWVSYDVVNVVGDASMVPLYAVGGSAVVAPPEPQAPSQPSTFNGWRASYYANKDLAGSPVLVQDVPEINFNWGVGSPGPNVPADYFSARYERTLSLPLGNYLLTLRMDDGARVFIDDQVVMDDWRTGQFRELTAVRTVGGSPRVRVEYFEDTGNAAIFFSITPFGSIPPMQPTPVPPQPMPPAPVPDLQIPQDQWRAQFYNNTDLAGNVVAAQYVSRSFYPLEQNWGAGSPVAGVGTDYWSARFEGNFYFSPASYDFFAQSDDGVRVYIDNILLINAWFDGYVDQKNSFDSIGEGYHAMRVEYYDRTANAYVRVWWSYKGNSQPLPGPIPPPPTPF